MLTIYSLLKSSNLYDDIITKILAYYNRIRSRDVQIILNKKFKQSRMKYSLKWYLFKQPIILRTCKQNIYNYALTYLLQNEIHHKTNIYSEERCFYLGYSEDCTDPECSFRDKLYYYTIEIY